MLTHKLTTGLVAIGVVLGFGLCSTATEPKPGHGATQPINAETALPKCPVTGEPVNFAISTATDDGPVYFCCKGCVKKFEADRGKYAASLAEQRKALASRPKVQVRCPVTDKPANLNIFITQNSEKIYFCSQECSSKFQKEPGKYKAALANSYTYQTTCPVMGEPINPQEFTTLATGETIYFCCPECEKKLLKEPTKYAPKLEAQGIKIDWAKAAQPSKEKEKKHNHERDHAP